MGTPCFIAGAWGTGKTLLLAYKAIKLSSEGRKVVFISNLDSGHYAVTTSIHYVFETKIRMDFESNENISFFTMKDIIKYLNRQNSGSQRSERSLLPCIRINVKNRTDQCKVQDKHSGCILIRFIKELLRTRTYHILIDELTIDNQTSMLAELQAIKLDSCSLTIAMKGHTNPSIYTKSDGDSERDSEPMGDTIILKKIMRNCAQILNEITANPHLHSGFYKPGFHLKDILVRQSTVQHTVLGCKPQCIKVSRNAEEIGLKEALSKVASHPIVVVLCGSGPHFVNYTVKVIRANSDKPVTAFTGESSQLEELRAFLRSSRGFLVTTPELYSGMEATSVIAVSNAAEWSLVNGLCRATTNLLCILIN